jgi:hypothetical protein
MLRAIARRRALAGVAASFAAGGAWSAPAGLPEQPSLMVAGPPGGWTDHWAEAIAPMLGRALQRPAPLPRENVGGQDGVTGANQFEARAEPDGSAAMLVPGSAALAWLAGEARVKFDPARWVPVWAGTRPAALASRVALVPGRRIRVGVRNVIGPEMAALLALDLLGMEVLAVQLDPTVPVATNRPDLDAVVLQGPALRGQPELLAATGWKLAIGFGSISANGQLVRDRLFPNLPIATELIRAPRHEAEMELTAALKAVCAATQLDLALVLPQLSPAAVVAWWRRGCGSLLGSAELKAEAARSLTRPVGPLLAGGSTGAIAVEAPVLLSLRRWLAERNQWHPT